MTGQITLEAIASLILFLAAGAFNGVMDTLQFHYSQSVFSSKSNQLYWNPKQSWRNKYKDGDPKQGPKFFGSTTFLVFLTDGWHFFQFLMLTSFALSGVFALLADFSIWWHLIIAFLAFRAVFSGGFHITYSWLLKIRTS